MRRAYRPSDQVSSPQADQSRRPFPLPAANVTGVLAPAHGGTGTSTVFSANRVVVAGPSGVYTQDAAFIWDLTNHRLGVGAASPQTDIELRHDTIGASPIADNVTTPAIGLRLANTAAATLGAQVQASPAIEFVGNAWDTDGAVTRQPRIGLFQNLVAGTVPEPFLSFRYDQGQGAGWQANEDMRIGRVLVGDSPSIRMRDANFIFPNNGSRGLMWTSTPLSDSVASNNQKIVGFNDGTIEISTLGSFLRLLGNTTGSSGIPMLDIRGFHSSAGAAPVQHIRFRATDAVGVSAGFGTRLLFQARSNGGGSNDRDQAAIDAVWGNAADAARSGDVVVQLVAGAAALAELFRFRSTGLVTFGGITASQPAIKPNGTVIEVKLADDSAFTELKAKVLRISDGTVMLRTAAALTNGAAANVGTLNNAPAVGDPTKWIPIDDNGTTRYIPAW